MRSIVRRGNHFIHLDGCGWVLIDGPWYERLMGYKNKPYVLIYSLQPVLAATIEESEPYPDVVDTREVTWERVRWHPGWCVFENPPLSLIISDWMQYKWREFLGSRRKFGWRMLPDGVLPAYLCQPELAEDWHHSNYLMEHGY